MLELCLGDVAGGCFRFTAGGIVSLSDAGKIKMVNLQQPCKRLVSWYQIDIKIVISNSNIK